uniref:Uncharacterized protein n=1 Tax=Oryza barthii TaxID=65489 RepID=A0A0D3GNV0_9ORYZ
MFTGGDSVRSTGTGMGRQLPSPAKLADGDGDRHISSMRNSGRSKEGRGQSGGGGEADDHIASQLGSSGSGEEEATLAATWSDGRASAEWVGERKRRRQGGWMRGGRAHQHRAPPTTTPSSLCPATEAPARRWTWWCPTYSSLPPFRFSHSMKHTDWRSTSPAVCCLSLSPTHQFDSTILFSLLLMHVFIIVNHS